MFQKVISSTIDGVEALLVHVEADVSDGLPVFSMVGYLSSQVKEAQDRVRAALRNLGVHLPAKRITINLSPADIRKEGTRFDLPIAVAILASVEYLPQNKLNKIMVLGELSLNGEIQAVTGVLPSVVCAKTLGCESCIIPKANLMEARMIEGIEVIGVSSLEEVVDYIRHGEAPRYEQILRIQEEKSSLDFADIHGQEAMKRAALIAAAGFHNMLLVGPPGSGKSMAAKRISGIMPPLTLEESLEVTNIYSIAGLLNQEDPSMLQRPFRSPHHTITPQALAGGGRIPKPGEITLAHKGILFLDEIPEFSRDSLEILRQPLEEKNIWISRNSGVYCFPAHFLLVAAMNPCPCGFYPNLNRCNCSAPQINRYMNRLSQPILDRIDLCVEALEVSYEQLTKPPKEPETAGSSWMREQVMRTQLRQKIRYHEEKISFNSELTPAQIEKYCPMSKQAEKMLKKSFLKFQFSARGYYKVLKVARTIADLEEKDTIEEAHITEAICFRSVDKKYWRI